MNLISRRKLAERVAEYPDAESAVNTWLGVVRAARWTCPDDMMRAMSGRCRSLPRNRAIFNIKGNNYRLICAIRYAQPDTSGNGTVFFKFFGTHAEYDKIDAATVDHP